MWLHSKQDEPHHAFRLAEQIMLHLIMNCYNDPLFAVTGDQLRNV